MFGEPLSKPRHDALGRRYYSDQAEAWTANQAERLGVTPEAIEATIKRGWLPDEIDAAETAAELLCEPPDRDVFGLKVVKGG